MGETLRLSFRMWPFHFDSRGEAPSISPGTLDVQCSDREALEALGLRGHPRSVRVGGLVGEGSCYAVPKDQKCDTRRWDASREKDINHPAPLAPPSTT